MKSKTKKTAGKPEFIHPHRTVGGHSHHRDSGGDAAAGAEFSQAESTSNQMCRKSPADRIDPPELQPGLRRIHYGE